MATLRTAEERASLARDYERDGFVVVEDVVDEAFLEELLKTFFHRQHAAGDVVARHQKGGGIDWKKIRNLAEKEDVFFKLATAQPVVDVVETLIEDEPLVFRDVMVVKPARHGAFLAYHQDAEFWDIEPSDLISVWIPLQDTTVTNGCLKVITGSHRKQYPHDLYITTRTRMPYWITRLLRRGASLSGTGDSDSSGFAFFRVLKNFVLGALTKIFPFLGRLQELVARVEEEDYAREIDVPVKRGGAIFFHGQLLHASNPNTSDGDRLAFIPSFMGRNFCFKGVGSLACLRARNGDKREYVSVKRCGTNESETTPRTN